MTDGGGGLACKGCGRELPPSRLRPMHSWNWHLNHRRALQTERRAAGIPRRIDGRSDTQRLVVVGLHKRRTSAAKAVKNVGRAAKWATAK